MVKISGELSVRSYHTPVLAICHLGLGNCKVGYSQRGVWYEPAGVLIIPSIGAISKTGRLSSEPAGPFTIVLLSLRVLAPIQ